MIRTAEWKYVHCYPYSPHELYDLKKDSDERKNLADDKSKVAVVEEMRKRLAEWCDRLRPQAGGGEGLGACSQGGPPGGPPPGNSTKRGDETPE